MNCVSFATKGDITVRLVPLANYINTPTATAIVRN